MGSLSAGSLELSTLEDSWHDNARNVSCIPEGTYLCPIAYSNRFQRLMPRLLDVPGRSGILIHSGNTEANTEGCILVGRSATGSAVYDSRGAFALFFDWLSKAWSTQPVWITIAHEGESA